MICLDLEYGLKYGQNKNPPIQFMVTSSRHATASMIVIPYVIDKSALLVDVFMGLIVNAQSR